MRKVIVTMLIIVLLSIIIIRNNTLFQDYNLILGDVNNKLGDVNGDGKLNTQDYILIRKYIIKIGSLNANQIKLADVNSDGKLNTMDYIMVKKQILTGESILTNTDISISESQLSLLVGNSITLTTNPSSNVTWSSSNPSVATVSNGTVTAVGDGTTIITATLGNKKANCNVLVRKPNQYTITFIGSEIINTGLEGKEVLIKGGKVSEHRSSKLNLATNTKYVVSFDYLAKSGTNKFDVDLYPDTLPQITPSATSQIQHYDWILASDSGDMANSQLRFFDDVRSDGENNISITNILMSKVIDKVYNEGMMLGELPTPTRNGYRFMGWYTDPKGGNVVTSSSQVTGNMTLYARWKGMYDHVFIVGIDGLGDTFGTNKVKATNFNNIFGNYAYQHKTKTETNTWSAPNWSSIMTGVTWETHGIDNDKAGSNERTSQTAYPTIFYYVKKDIPNAKLASIVNWNPINIGIIENDLGVYKDNVGIDNEVTNKVLNYLDANNGSEPTLMFVHLCDVDHAAHNYVKKNGINGCQTCGGYSDEYYNAAQVADGMLGTIYNKIESLGLMQNSLFIVVADHGETYNAHGNSATSKRDTKEEVAVLAVRGYNVNKMTFNTSVHNRDLSAIVLKALGIDKPEIFVSTVPSGLFNQ